jgi:hypothetical protein
MKKEQDVPTAHIEGENVLYPVTEVELQEIAEERIERELTEEEIGCIVDIVNEKLMWIVPEAIDEIGEFSELESKGVGNENANPRYEIHWKDENAFQNEFICSNAFIEEEDARLFADRAFPNPCEEYKIEKVKGEVRQIIVHHKNPLMGGDGFHMDVHAEPKSIQNAHDLDF